MKLARIVQGIGKMEGLIRITVMSLQEVDPLVSVRAKEFLHRPIGKVRAW